VSYHADSKDFVRNKHNYFEDRNLRDFFSTCHSRVVYGIRMISGIFGLRSALVVRRTTVSPRHFPC
jgi:hypothetical protein